MLAWGQTLKGFKKTFNHRKQSLVFLLVWQITQNDDAQQKCQENAGDNSSGRPPRRYAQHKIMATRPNNSLAGVMLTQLAYLCISTQLL